MLKTHIIFSKKYEEKVFLYIIIVLHFKGSESFMLRKQARETLQVASILEKSSTRRPPPQQDASEEGRVGTVTLMATRRRRKPRKTKKERKRMSVKMR